MQTIVASWKLSHDRQKYTVYVELPGVAKKEIELELGEHHFDVFAQRDDVVCTACSGLAHAIDPRKSDAKCENGLLRITMPLKQPLRGVKIPVK